jgi:hypothetical protein
MHDRSSMFGVLGSRFRKPGTSNRSPSRVPSNATDTRMNRGVTGEDRRTRMPQGLTEGRLTRRRAR